jgi:hypothetical protein
VKGKELETAQELQAIGKRARVLKGGGDWEWSPGAISGHKFNALPVNLQGKRRNAMEGKILRHEGLQCGAAHVFLIEIGDILGRLLAAAVNGRTDLVRPQSFRKPQTRM